MITIQKHRVQRFRPAIAVRRPEEPVVKNGLAVTPSDMVDMMQHGMSISAQAYSILDKESLAQRNDFEVPLEHRKGFDMVDAWTLKQDVLGRFRDLRQGVKSGKVETQTEGQQVTDQ